jgi:hypothetical protein
VLTGKQPEDAADIPAAGKARVDRKGTVNQSDHGADLLAKAGQYESRIGEDARVVLGLLER